MSLPPGALDAIRELAEVAAKTAATAATDERVRDYCPSFFVPRGFFKRKVIKTLEVVCGVRRTAVSGELVRIDLDVDDSSISDVRQAFRSYAAELIEGLGCVLDDTPEGIVILRCNRDAVKDRHVDASDQKIALTAAVAKGGGHE
jgi:hypothetical protein